MDKYWNPMVPELLVSDFKKSFEFYSNILKFSVRIRRKNPDFVYLEKEKVQIMLEQLHEDAWLVGGMTIPFGRGVNFQMEFEDINSVYDSLAGHRVDLYKDIQESWYDIGDCLSGQKEFLVQDPDGYLLRFTEYLGEKPKL